MSDEQEKDWEYRAVKRYIEEVKPPKIDIEAPSTWSRVVVLGLLVAMLLATSAFLIHVFAGLTK